ncbi:DUF2164 domain-containing protein [Brevundimonas pondensis]|uniref:DUF2164 domain-containing protein n=1 Tax=Brevundimonas pondensis TaxID=2774189 RepID=UPI00320B8F1C
MMKKPAATVLTREELQDAASRLRAYLRDEMDVEVGQLPAEMLVEFIERDIGRLFYNRGLRDAETVVRQKVEDVADALYGLER